MTRVLFRLSNVKRSDFFTSMSEANPVCLTCGKSQPSVADDPWFYWCDDIANGEPQVLIGMKAVAFRADALTNWNLASRECPSARARFGSFRQMGCGRYTELLNYRGPEYRVLSNIPDLRTVLIGSDEVTAVCQECGRGTFEALGRLFPRIDGRYVVSADSFAVELPAGFCPDVPFCIKGWSGVFAFEEVVDRLSASMISEVEILESGFVAIT